jgi:hypothetical protein
LFKNLKHSSVGVLACLITFSSCATPVEWSGDLGSQVKRYMSDFNDFRRNSCGKKTEAKFETLLKSYRGQGYWIPELNADVDVETIRSLLPEMEKKLNWIKDQREKVTKSIPEKKVTAPTRELLKKLLVLKKDELSVDEAQKNKSRKESLKLQEQLQKSYKTLTSNVPFLTSFKFPVDHLKNRKVHDEYKDKDAEASVKISNFTFLYRKLLEDGAYNKDHTGSDIYLRTTLDTLHFELKQHDFYLTEDARYDLEFVLSKIESEIEKGQKKLVERLKEWEERTERTLAFYSSLTDPLNQKPIVVDGVQSTPNRELIKQHNVAAEELKKYVYEKQAEVYKYWLGQSELSRAVYVLETILMNEVGPVDGQDALERQDVARVVMNRLNKPKYITLGKKQFIYPYVHAVTSESKIQNEKWLNVLFKQGEFSFTYYYMGGVAKIFCPDMNPTAKKLRAQNVEIALQVLKEGTTAFQATRYFSRASMIGRIHMDSIWEDYIPYPERPGLLAPGQENLTRAFKAGDYTYLYSFKDPAFELYQVIEVNGHNYAMATKEGVTLFFKHRNPHYFKYFTKTEIP